MVEDNLLAADWQDSGRMVCFFPFFFSLFLRQETFLPYPITSQRAHKSLNSLMKKHRRRAADSHGNNGTSTVQLRLFCLWWKWKIGHCLKKRENMWEQVWAAVVVFLLFFFVERKWELEGSLFASSQGDGQRWAKASMFDSCTSLSRRVWLSASQSHVVAR